MKFKLEMELGNDEMKTPREVLEAVRASLEKISLDVPLHKKLLGVHPGCERQHGWPLDGALMPESLHEMRVHCTVPECSISLAVTGLSFGECRVFIEGRGWLLVDGNQFCPRCRRKSIPPMQFPTASST